MIRTPHHSISYRFLAFFIFCFLGGGALSFCGCEKLGGGSGGKTVVRINDLQATAEDLQQERSSTRGSLDAAGAAAGQEPEWLTRFIERELLVQEAQRLGLDREQVFMRSIERFWKEALVKQLVDRKAREISSQVHIYEPEIEAYYRQLEEEAKGGPMPPMAEMREGIQKLLRQHKETEAMERWLEDLRTTARIEVDQQEVQRLR